MDALGGAPGVHSSRFAGPGADEAANNEKLLQELASGPDLHLGGAFKDADRTAHYVCVIALAEHGRILTVTEGRADGVILEAPRGSGGFGYDPLFFYPPLSKTFAELCPEEKFAVSHRGKAFWKLLNYLRDLQ